MFVSDFFLEQIEGIIYVIGGILASVLLSLSFYAYGQNRVKKILYASFAFAVFAVYSFFEALENFYPILDSSFTDVIVASILILVLILFFLAIGKK